MLAGHDNYMGHILAIASSEPVFFNRDVFTENGFLLIKKATKFDVRAYDLIGGHKLKEPLDEAVTIDRRVGAADIAARIGALIRESGCLRALGKSLGQRQPYVRAITGIAAHEGLANRITVMQRRLPKLFDHSLEVAVMAVAIGGELRLPERVLSHLAMAGLLHDIGELYIDSKLHDPGLDWTEREWQTVYHHPSIAFELLGRYPDIPAEVAKAIHEHHERADGGGYPQALTGEGQVLEGRILAAAEVVTSLCRNMPLPLTGKVFRSCDSRLDKRVTQAVDRLLWRMRAVAAPGSAEVDAEELMRLSDAVSRVMRSWRSLAPRLYGYPLARAERLFARVDQIRVALCDAGIEPENCGNAMSYIGAGPDALVEVASLMREVGFQLGAVVHETRRSWHFQKKDKSGITLAVERWLKQAGRVLESSKAAVDQGHTRAA